MAAMTLEPRDPDMSRFIDQYKFERQMDERRNKFGGGTSLPLNSDGYEDRQRFLKEERHKDWVEYQEKNVGYKPTINPYPHPKLTRGPQNRTSYDLEIQKMSDRYVNRYDNVLVSGDEQEPVYYRVGTPEKGLPLGKYEQQRHEINLQRQRDYNKMMMKQRKLEQERIEQRRRNRPPPAQPQTNAIDYNEARELANTEDRRAYQDYQGKAHIKPPVSYEENRKVLAEERKQDYAQYQEKKAKEERYRAMRGRPVTPPGQGLDVGQYDRHVRETKAQKTKEYKEMLDQQASQRLKYRYLERLADTSPNYVKYRDEERPLVGSPRDINPALYEKKSRNTYDKDIENKSTPRTLESPPAPPVKSPVEDPNAKIFLEIERQKVLEKKQYGEELRKQQKEQMYMKAQRENEMAVLDRQRMAENQYPAGKPPAGPGYKPRDEPLRRQTPSYRNEGRRALSPKSFHSEAHRRQRDDGVPLAFQTNTHSRPRSRSTDQGYIPSLSDAPVRGKLYDDRSRPPQRELLPPNSPHRRTPPPRTPPPRNREFEDQKETFQTKQRRHSPPPRTPVGSEQSVNQSRPPRRRSPPPRLPPGPGSEQSDQSHPNYADLSPRRRKVLDTDESQYDKMRKTANIERKEDYNRYIREKEDDRRRQLSNRPTGKPAEVVKGPYYSSDNYESYQAELRRKQLEDYKEFLQKNYQPPPGAEGLPLEQARYEPKRLALEAERNVDYNEHMQKSPRDQDGEKVKGPQGLPLDPKKAVEKAKWLEKQRNREYNELLKKEEEIRNISSYVDVPNPFLPPPTHNPRLPEPYQTNTHIYQQSMKAPYPKAASAPAQTDIPVTPNKLSLPLGQYDDVRPFLIKQRNREYNNFKEQLPPARAPRVTPDATATGLSLPLGEHDESLSLIEKQRVDEYNKSLAAQKITKISPREKAHTPPSLQGLPIGQHNYEPLYRAMEYQRNKEYNEFVNKKFGQKKAKSEPDRPNKASFYLGNENIHTEKRRFLETERQKEYNDFLKQRPPAPSKDFAIASDVDSGLPIGQQHHEAWRKFLREQRNREYNQLVDKTSTHAPKNRNWKESENGLLLPEDHTMEYRKRELQNQRKKEYQEHLAQKKAPPNHYWPEPDPGRGALWLKKGGYEGVREMYDEERKKEFMDNLEKKQQQNEKSCNPRPKSEPNPGQSEYEKPIVEALGRYEELREKLKEARRKEFVEFLDKEKHHQSERRHGDEPPSTARDEKPLVYSMGKYDLEQIKKIREEAHKDLANYFEQKRKNLSPRRLEKELPHLATAEDPFVNHMGNYEKERKKYMLERHKDCRDYTEKYKQRHHSPWKNFVYPLNAHLEHPVVEKMECGMAEKKRLLRNERRRDYERYLSEQRMNEVPRRDDYGSNVDGPYDGMFHGLGERDGNKDALSHQRRQEYNDRLEQQYLRGDRPTGRPSWAKDPVTDQDYGDRGRSPLKSPGKADRYEQMLHEKRREEAQRRRYDDPEYQDKLARMESRERGPARDQARYGY